MGPVHTLGSLRGAARTIANKLSILPYPRGGMVSGRNHANYGRDRQSGRGLEADSVVPPQSFKPTLTPLSMLDLQYTAVHVESYWPNRKSPCYCS